MPSATIGLTFLGGLTKKSTPTYVSARLSMKIKNYNLLSSVTLSDVIA